MADCIPAHTDRTCSACGGQMVSCPKHGEFCPFEPIAMACPNRHNLLYLYGYGATPLQGWP